MMAILNTTSNIKTLNSIKEFNIESIEPNTLVLVDIDQTIITPDCLICDPRFPYYTIFDNLKKLASENLISQKYAQSIMGIFRNLRAEVLVEKQWLELVKNIKNKNIQLLALTSLNTGVFSAMDDHAEEWRYNILAKLGIHFSDHDKIIKFTDDMVDYAIFYRGIIQTGKYSKSDSLEFYLRSCQKRPNKIIFFDDRLQQLKDVSSKAKEHNISYEGFHYLAAKDFQVKDYDENQALWQLEILLKYGKLITALEEFKEKKHSKLISDSEYNLILEKTANGSVETTSI